MADKIDKKLVYVGCGLGQHPDSTKYNSGCNACIAATLDKLIDILNLSPK